MKPSKTAQPRGKNMRNVLSITLTYLLLWHLVTVASAAETVEKKIEAIPQGSGIELRLKNKQTLKGNRGPTSEVGFTLIDPRTGDQKIAFNDVISVKRSSGRSHAKRNVLIGIAVGLAALGITIGVIHRCGPFGCNAHFPI